MVCRLGAGYRICAPGSRMALGGFFISGSVVGLQGLRCRGFLLDVPFGLCVRAADSFLVGPGYGLSWRVSCPRCAWVPLSECWGGRVVNSERGLSPGQTASVLLKQHAPCIPPQHSAGGKSPDSPAKPYPGPTRKQAARVKAQTALAEVG